MKRLAVLIACIAASGAGEPNFETDPLCGVRSLHVALLALEAPDQPDNFADLQAQLGPVGTQGYSLLQLAQAAEKCGLHTLGVKTTAARLAARSERFACIAHVRGDHFLLIYDIDAEQAHIIDPPRDYTLPLATLDHIWDGTALLIGPEPFVPEEELSTGGLFEAPLLRIAIGILAALLLVTCVARVVMRMRSRA